MNVDRIADEIVKGLPESFRASLQEWDLVKERIRQAVMKELQREPVQRRQVGSLVTVHAVEQAHREHHDAAEHRARTR